MAEDEFLGAKPIVIDNGTGLSKNGYAGEDQPRSVWPTLIGYPRYESIMTDVDHYTRDYYIGEEAINLRGVLRLVYPIAHGIVESPKASCIRSYSSADRSSRSRSYPNTHPCG